MQKPWQAFLAISPKKLLLPGRQSLSSDAACHCSALSLTALPPVLTRSLST